ncbi:pyruvate kinase [Candidatus Uhrbacteria bacterium]|nr:pyruvate kinase [Candidatus Uhrbacteria bacterium]
MKKYTKIVCTIGPASEKLPMMRKLIRAGMNVARLNFSHGSYPSHAALIRNLRKAASLESQSIAILQDLQGPRIRIGEVSDEGVVLKNGDRIVLVPQSSFQPKGESTFLPYHYEKLAREVEVGQHILIADGMIDLRILRIAGPDIHCSVRVGGVVKSHKGINVPGATFSVPAITAKDKKDLAFGVQHGVDFVALSFVRTPDHVKEAHRLLSHLSKKYPHAKKIKILAKIERPEAVHDFDEILQVVDGIMVARGDLGIEIPAQKVPVIQKTLIQKCIAARKPVIVATQMLESMISSRRPTRAEVSDVANAVVDHTDAVMLSGESATGKYPLETVQIMAKTLHEAEASRYDDYVCQSIKKETAQRQMIAHAAADLVLSKKITCIVVEDHDAALVCEITSHRPEVPIYCFSTDAVTRHQMNLLRGVRCFVPQKNVRRFLQKQKLLRRGGLYLTIEACEVEIERV